MSHQQDISAALKYLDFGKFPPPSRDWQRAVRLDPIKSNSQQALAQAQKAKIKYTQWTQSPDPRNTNTFWKAYIKALRMISYNEQHISVNAVQLETLLNKILVDNQQFDPKKGLPKTRDILKPTQPTHKQEGKSENIIVRFFKWLISKLFGTKKSAKQAKKAPNYRIVTQKTSESAQTPSSDAFRHGSAKVTGSDSSYTGGSSGHDTNRPFGKSAYQSFNPYSTTCTPG